MKKIYITRHGQTDWNLVPKVQGITDIPLNKNGIEQAYNLAESIFSSTLEINKILCSPLSRAFETAKIISEKNHIPMQIEPKLIEQNFGKWEGWFNKGNDQSFHEAKQQFINCYETGETMFKLAQRIYNLLDDLKNKDCEENYLLVTHGGIARVIHSYFYDMTNEQFASFSIKNCEIKEYLF